MQLQRRGNYRRAFNARPRTFVAEHTAQDERVKLHGIFKRQKCTYDIRQTRKSEIHRRRAVHKFGNRHFWAEGYYVSTVGMNEATIKKYIQDQEKQDIMKDKLS